MKLHRLFVSLFVLAILVIAASVPVLVAHAAPGFQELPPAPAAPSAVDFADLVGTLTSLAGVAALIAVAVNLLKQIGIVKDGQAGSWSAGLNLAALIGLFAAQVAGYSNLIPVIDEQAGALAVVLSTVAAYVFQVFISRKAHDSALAGLPAVGASYSGRLAGETYVTEVPAESQEVG